MSRRTSWDRSRVASEKCRGCPIERLRSTSRRLTVDVISGASKALAVSADFIITVNTARGHFDRAEYQGVKVRTPGAFVNLPVVQKLVQKHFGAA